MWEEYEFVGLGWNDTDYVHSPEFINPRIIVLGGGNFGRCLGFDDGAIMKGINAL